MNNNLSGGTQYCKLKEFLIGCEDVSPLRGSGGGIKAVI